uniref:DUF4110 domain-containing protein n=1 Tax=Macrostomum lignano TaxID=282301 RepID=A0A1I8JQH8_9PLAT
FIYETERHNGIAELLEILGSIINGFALPSKRSTKEGPLAGPAGAARAAALLAEGPLAQGGDVPDELEEILDVVDPVEFRKVRELTALPVAERARLYYWNNEYVLSLMSDNASLAMPIVFPALLQNQAALEQDNSHSVYQCAQACSWRWDQKLFDECTIRYQEERQREARGAGQTEQLWQQLAAQAMDNPLYPVFCHGAKEQRPSNRRVDKPAAAGFAALRRAGARGLAEANASGSTGSAGGVRRDKPLLRRKSELNKSKASNSGVASPCGHQPWPGVTLPPSWFSLVPGTGRQQSAAGSLGGSRSSGASQLRTVTERFAAALTQAPTKIRDLPRRLLRDS